ncbi:unnamed protein product, partial [Nesidiocoris tenuis]
MAWSCFRKTFYPQHHSSYPVQARKHHLMLLKVSGILLASMDHIIMLDFDKRKPLKCDVRNSKAQRLFGAFDLHYARRRPFCPILHQFRPNCAKHFVAELRANEPQQTQSLSILSQVNKSERTQRRRATAVAKFQLLESRCCISSQSTSNSRFVAESQTWQRRSITMRRVASQRDVPSQRRRITDVYPPSRSSKIVISYWGRCLLELPQMIRQITSVLVDKVQSPCRMQLKEPVQNPDERFDVSRDKY